jgi:hypothetical protein
MDFSKELVKMSSAEIKKLRQSVIMSIVGVLLVFAGSAIATYFAGAPLFVPAILLGLLVVALTGMIYAGRAVAKDAAEGVKEVIRGNVTEQGNRAGIKKKGEREYLTVGTEKVFLDWKYNSIRIGIGDAVEIQRAPHSQYIFSLVKLDNKA